MKKRMVVAATATAVVGLAASVTAASAADWVYYSVAGQGGPKLGKVQLDGTTGRNDAVATFTETIAGIAATASDAYVVTQQNQSNNKTLWKVDASGNKTNLLGALMCSTVSGTSAYGLATDGSYLYYMCTGGPNSNTTKYLARVGLDGTSRNETFSASLTGIYAEGAFTVGDGYAYFRAGASSGFGADRLYRLPLTAGATPTPSSTSDTAQDVAWSPAGLFAMNNPQGQTRPLSRFSPSAFPGWSMTTVFPSLSTSMQPVLAADTKSLFWTAGGMGQASALVKANADGSGTPNTSFLTVASPTSIGPYVAVNPSGPTGGSTPAPTPTPAPAPSPTPAASTLATPTVSTSTPGENAVVTVKVQLAEKGKYTFIFERPTSNEMSREQATSNRVPMQKGSRIGTRRLKKTYTAAVITTTADNAKVVTRALLRKAQAKKVNLRVVYAPTGTPQSESVIKIK